MKRISLVLVLLMVYALLTFTVYADTLPKYSVREWRISAVVNLDGSMDVEERITYSVSRSHEGPVVRHVDIAHSSSMENLEVFAVIPADTEGSDQSEADAELEPYKFVDQPDQDTTKVYTTKPGARPEEVQDILIYLPDGSGQHTVVLKYRLNDLVYLYRDVAVLYWNPVLKDYGLDVQNMDMRIALPPGTKPEGIKPFVYGALEGNCEVLDDGIANIMAKRLGPKEFMEVTLVFPKDGVVQGRKVIDNDGLERISEEQRLKSEEMELLKRRKDQELKLRLAAIVGAAAGIVGIGVWVAIWMSRRRLRSSEGISKVKTPAYDKAKSQVVMTQRAKVAEQPKADRSSKVPAIDLPADYYTPAELSVLLRGKRIKPSDMVATLIDLVVRKYLDVQVSTGKSYVLSLRNFDFSSLKPHEEYLINWFFKNIGNGRKVSIEEILQATYARGFEKEFCNRYTIWKQLALREAVRWGFHKRVTPFKVYLRTPFGKQHYKDWLKFKKALKKALKQLRHRADNLSPSDWERFFAYAFSMGIGQKVVKELKKAYREETYLKGDLTILRGHNLDAIDRWFDLDKRLSHLSSRLLRLVYSHAGMQHLGVRSTRGKSI